MTADCLVSLPEVSLTHCSIFKGKNPQWFTSPVVLFVLVHVRLCMMIFIFARLVSMSRRLVEGTVLFLSITFIQGRKQLCPLFFYIFFLNRLCKFGESLFLPVIKLPKWCSIFFLQQCMQLVFTCRQAPSRRKVTSEFINLFFLNALKLWGRSVYSDTYYAYCQEFLTYLLISTLPVH